MDINKKSNEVSFTSNDFVGTRQPPHGIRRIICIVILFYGMLFNGFIYGYSSPAIPSFRKDLKIERELDILLPK